MIIRQPTGEAANCATCGNPINVKVTGHELPKYAALKAIGIVVTIYFILPRIILWTTILIWISVKAIQTGSLQAIYVDSYQKSTETILNNLGAFSSGLIFLVGSGVFALAVWVRLVKNMVFRLRSFLVDMIIGIGVGVITYYFLTMILIPWLYNALPSGASLPRAEFTTISQYKASSMDRVATLFFCNGIFTPFVESVIFVGFIYRILRYQWGWMASMLLRSYLWRNPSLRKSILILFSFWFVELCAL